jgi:GNAT superfamily N-acetyltransferase
MAAYPPTMDVSIRKATSSDWPGISALLAELGRPDARGTPDEERHRSLFETYLERDDVDAFVADQDGHVVGFVNVEYRDRLNRTTPEAWIPELVVDEEKRSAGVGKRLLAETERVARERGCWGLALESATWRKDAHRFYEREGWEHAAKAFIKQSPS